MRMSYGEKESRATMLWIAFRQDLRRFVALDVGQVV